MDDDNYVTVTSHTYSNGKTYAFLYLDQSSLNFYAINLKNSYTYANKFDCRLAIFKTGRLNTK